MKKAQLAIRVIIIVLIVLLTINIYQTRKAFKNMSTSYNGFISGKADVERFVKASNYLTSQARLYVANGKQEFLENYLGELKSDKNRELALSELEKGAGSDNEVFAKLKECYDESNELTEKELKALKLVANANNATKELIEQIGDIKLTDLEMSVGAEGAKIMAIDMLFSEEYNAKKTQIDEALSECGQMVTDDSKGDGAARLKTVDVLLKFMFGFVIVVAVVEAVLFLPSVSGGSFFGSFEDEDNKKSLEAIEQLRKETEEINRMMK